MNRTGKIAAIACMGAAFGSTFYGVHEHFVNAAVKPAVRLPMQIAAVGTTGMTAPTYHGSGLPGTVLTCNTAAQALLFVNDLTGQISLCGSSGWVDLITAKLVQLANGGPTATITLGGSIVSLGTQMATVQTWNGAYLGEIFTCGVGSSTASAATLANLRGIGIATAANQVQLGVQNMGTGLLSATNNINIGCSPLN